MYLNKFVEKVARHSHNFRHVNDDQVFNEGKFWTEMRQSLYNTERNEKTRGASVGHQLTNAPAKGNGHPETEAEEVDKTERPEEELPPSLRKSDPSDASGIPVEDFFNFKRSAKRPHPNSPQGGKLSEPNTETLATPSKGQRSGSVAPPGTAKKNKRKAEDDGNSDMQTKTQRPDTISDGCDGSVTNAYDHLALSVARGLTLRDCIESLKIWLNIWRETRRRAPKKTCDKIEELIVTLAAAQPGDSWKALFEEYKPHLLKLPTGL